jgi:hypothetical protein
MRFVRAIGVTHVSYSKSSDFLGSPVGHETKLIPGRNRLRASVLNLCSEANKKYRLITVQFSDPFLSILFILTMLTLSDII